MDLSVSQEILDLLVCPETRLPLRLASPEELRDWTAEESFESALVTTDGSRAYPVRDGFPVLVAAEALRKEGRVAE
ncbi:MAG TPA: Trm112 family protein [Bacteroidia bacterium]|nr:Trm112 family protein [Bacteroidia bacterium]